MKVIILCGGAGTRLKEETEFKPKPMVSIGGKPILWHIMKMYSHWGFRDFILALGYKGEYIKDYFLDQKAFTSDFTINTKTFKKKYFLKNGHGDDDFNITFVDTGVEALPGERVLKCGKYIPEKDSDFMATYGDAVSDINIKKLVCFHRTRKTMGTITGIHPRSRFGLVGVDKNDIVTSFDEKPILDDWVSGGFMVFKRKALELFARGETEHVALKRMVDKKELSLYKFGGFWYCMDTYKEMEELNLMWKEDRCPWRVWK